MFQSTRPHGARPRRKLLSSVPALFQSTRPHGARQCVNLLWILVDVSIHAPARGATINFIQLIGGICFNPRARTGRDTEKQ